jgi:hypothetical protein
MYYLADYRSEKRILHLSGSTRDDVKRRYDLILKVVLSNATKVLSISCTTSTIIATSNSQHYFTYLRK